MADSAQQKSEQATPKRRDEARDRGNVAKSRELPSAAVLLAGLGALVYMAKSFHYNISSLMITIFNGIDRMDLGEASTTALLDQVLYTMTAIVLPVMVVIFITAALANFIQVGALFTLKPIQPKLSKLNPASGIKRMFSLNSLTDLVKNVMKLLLVGWVAYKTVIAEMPTLMNAADMSIGGIVIYILDLILTIFLRCSLLILALALFDYFYQRWNWERQLKMTKQEVKDEFKNREGDPLVKSKIRQIQRQLASRRMMDDVPSADVIVTNPTHLAVALKYDKTNMDAPKIVAKGADQVAQRIKKIAAAYDVPVVENKPLARTLFKLEIGQVIPEDLYQTVAHLLAYVYSLDRRAAAA